MKCIAIDDEPIALSIISNFCERKGGLELTVFDDPLKGIEAIESQKPHLVFLDIEMNDLSGLDVAKKLPDDVMIVFTTAHANYALNSYEFWAIDFLHKPFAYDRFEKAINRALEIRKFQKLISNATPENDNHLINLKVEYRNVALESSKILFIEAMDNYVKVFTDDQRMTISQMSLKAILELLPPKNFIRIHRSFIVAKNQIASYTKKSVKLKTTDDINIPVGRIYAAELYQIMKSVD